MLKCVLTYLETNALLPPTQSAYRRHHSTETAVLKVVSDIWMAIDRGNVAILLLLDMSAAFDAMDHNILIEKLDRTFAIRQMALDWLRSYLKKQKSTYCNCICRFSYSKSLVRSTAGVCPWTDSLLHLCGRYQYQY